MVSPEDVKEAMVYLDRALQALNLMQELAMAATGEAQIAPAMLSATLRPIRDNLSTGIGNLRPH